MEKPDCKSALKELGCCVLVPTYNNEKTLNRVIDGVLEYANDIIVVCDGATDYSLSILKAYGNKIELIEYLPNKGKGNALKVGFKKAVELGFEYAISIDSDGQHYPEDIARFIEKIREQPGVLIVGSRNMNQENVPGKSSFGNKFSNFWFRLETGINLPDTQSGFRLYPVQKLSKIRFYTEKFEFEIEVMVKAAWADIVVTSVPVQVLYNPEERVSHFRPFKDFTRISILNTYLVTLTLLYYKPRDIIRKLKKKSLKQFIKETLFASGDSILKKTFSVMLGIFVGCSPLWGFQTGIVIGLALLLKLNRTLAFLTSNISVPPLLPFIVLGSIEFGELVTGQHVSLDFTDGINWEMFKENLIVFIVGSFIFAALVSLLGGMITYLTLRSYQNTRK